VAGRLVIVVVVVVVVVFVVIVIVVVASGPTVGTRGTSFRPTCEWLSYWRSLVRRRVRAGRLVVVIVVVVVVVQGPARPRSPRRMVQQMYANTPAANLEAVLQHRHQPHHRRRQVGGHGRWSRAVCLRAAAHWPMPKKIARGPTASTRRRGTHATCVCHRRRAERKTVVHQQQAENCCTPTTGHIAVAMRVADLGVSQQLGRASEATRLGLSSVHKLILSIPPRQKETRTNAHRLHWL
jgi:hypothetical protein